MRQWICLSLLFLTAIGSARGDALVVTQAMKASTIAEIFVDEDEIRVELEIGPESFDAFRNLLPDEWLNETSSRPGPREHRLREFLSSDWRMEADGEQLPATVSQLKQQSRVARDEITGYPLPVQPADAETVVRATLRYPLSGRPQVVTVAPPGFEGNRAPTNVGFVAYHQGVAVNDFRYLSAKETLRLDWSDPWYSAFERKTLRRRYYAPAAAFLYVENLEVRKEIVIRPRDLQAWVDLGLAGRSVISAADREKICAAAAALLDRRTPLEIDGQTVTGTLDRVHFIERTLRTAGIVPPDKDIPINQAIIGAIYVYPVESLPNQVIMKWEMFNDRIRQVPAVATDEAGGMPSLLFPDDAQLTWKNYLKNPTVPGFLEVAPPQSARSFSLSLISVGCVLLLAALWITVRGVRKTMPRTRFLMVVTTLLLIGVGAQVWQRFHIAIPLEKQAVVSHKEGGAIVYGLLHNIYRAFDYRDESTVYDVLDRSAQGDLLTKVYLDTRQSLTLASQGGARVKVKAVDMTSCEVKPSAGETFVAHCHWMVSGTVGHWGHVHQRTNQYEGVFTVKAIQGRWKFTDMEVLSEVRQ